MKVLKEFKEFAVRGNVIDLAVGVIIGAAFGKIVTSLVSDIIMPPFGRMMGALNFNDLFIPLVDAPGVRTLAQAKEQGIPVLAYGAFLTTVLDFAIVAFCIFLMVKAINALKREPPPDPTTKECPQCAMTIPIKAVRCGHCTTMLT
jgi:large conductance mechanosensitive channel